MKRLISLLCLISLLLTALPALAEDQLHTFAGVPWGTPRDSFIDVAKPSGLPFDSHRDEWGTTITLAEGVYSVFGLSMTASGFNAEFHFVENTPSLASLTLEPSPLAMTTDAQGQLVMPEEIADAYQQFLTHFGTPDCAYIWMPVGWSDVVYQADPAEAPWILKDAHHLASLQGCSRYTVAVCCDNVMFRLEMNPNNKVPVEACATVLYNNSVYTAAVLDNYFDADFSFSNANALPYQNGELAPIVLLP